MRSREDVKNSNRHNETKFLILKIFTPRLAKWITSLEVAKACDISANNASQQMKKLSRQNYIWRKDIGKKSYRYRFLKPMGDRVLKELWIRDWLLKKTGDPRIDLNLEHTIPDEIKIMRIEAEQHFNTWLFHGK